MAATDDVTEGVQNLITGAGDQSKTALDAVRRFIDSVNDAIPEGPGSELRDQVIENAFAMTHQVVEASNRLATGLVESTGKTVSGLAGKDSSKDA